MSAADDLARARARLQDAAEAIQSAAEQLQQPYAAPLAMALADTIHAGKSVENIGKAIRARGRR